MKLFVPNTKPNGPSGLTKLLALLPLLTSALSFAAETEPQRLIYVEEALPTSMNPLFPSNDVDRRIHQLVFDYLYERSVVAEGHRSRVVESYVAQPDENRYLLQLKKGLRWHDKQPLTSADICFSIQALQHQETPASWPVPANVQRCEAVDPQRVAITFERQIIDLPSHLNFPLIPAHAFDGPAIEREHPFQTAPIGSGPMQAKLDERNRWHLTAHKSPHVGAKIEELMLETGGDLFAQAQLLLAGAVDGMIRVPPSSLSKIAEHPKLSLQANPSNEWWFIAMNTSSESLKDSRVREAVDNLLHRELLRTTGLGEDGAQEASSVHWMTGPFLPNTEYTNQSLYPVLSSNAPRAESLFVKAGFVRLPNRGALVKGTTPLKLRIGVIEEVEQLAPNFAEELGRQLRAGGLEPTFESVPNAEWAMAAGSNLIQKLDMVVGTNQSSGLLGVEQLFHSTGELNFFRYSNPTVDRLIEGLKLDPSSMEAHFAAWELHTLLAQERPFLFLWHLESWSAWSTRVSPVIITPETYFADFETWAIRQ